MAILELDEHVIETKAGPRTVVSVTPSGPVVFRREDLARMSSVFEPSPRDEEIITALRQRRRPADVFVFQSQALDGGPGCWYFEDGLSEAEVDELGFHIVRAHRFVYRGLVDAGINMAIGAAKGYRELAALRTGTERLARELAAELEHCAGDDRMVCEADLFLVRHLMVFTSLDLPVLLRGLIPDKLPLCERRAPRFRELRARVRPIANAS